MANNLFGHRLDTNSQTEIQDNSDEELSSYMDDNCGTCARCGSREYLNNGRMCSSCNETWG